MRLLGMLICAGDAFVAVWGGIQHLWPAVVLAVFSALCLGMWLRMESV